MRERVLGSIVLLLAFGARAQQGETCGEISAEGECREQEAVYCTDPAGDAGAPLARVPCDDLRVDPSGDTVEGTCAVLDGYGAWCVLPEGAPCAGFDDDTLFAFGCGDRSATLVDDAACDLSDGCVLGVGACDPSAPGPARCLDERVTVACTTWGQWVTLSCDDPIIEGRCVDGACVVDEGRRCSPEGPVVCGAGLTCVGATEERAGTCVRGDGGFLDDGDGLDGGVPDGGELIRPPLSIACHGARIGERSIPGALGLGALLGLLLGGRRPRRRSGV